MHVEMHRSRLVLSCHCDDAERATKELEKKIQQHSENLVISLQGRQSGRSHYMQFGTQNNPRNSLAATSQKLQLFRPLRVQIDSRE